MSDHILNLSSLMYVCIAVILIATFVTVGTGEIYDGLVKVMQTKPVLQPEISETIRTYQYDPLN